MAKKSAFFVTPIGSEGSEARERSDRVQQFVLKPVLERDFQIVRADQVATLGSINHDIIRRLYEADLVIADLTGTNPNVMYEIGIRHSFNRPIIQIAQKDQPLPFDLGSERTIFFDIHDIKDIEDAKAKIRASVDSAFSQEYEGPVHRTLGLIAIFREDQTVAEAIEALGDRVGDVELALSDIDLDYSIKEEISYLYQIFSGVRPYDIDRFVNSLRDMSSKQ